MQRVLKGDGLLPNVMDPELRDTTPDDVRAMRAWLQEHGARDGFDVVAEGATPTDPAEAAAVVRPWADAGATWWIEALWVAPEGADHDALVLERLRAGPPVARLTPRVLPGRFEEAAGVVDEHRREVLLGHAGLEEQWDHVAADVAVVPLGADVLELGRVPVDHAVRVVRQHEPLGVPAPAQLGDGRDRAPPSTG